MFPLRLAEIHYPVVEVLVVLIQAAFVLVFTAQGKCIPAAILSGSISVQIKPDSIMFFQKRACSFKEGYRVQHYKIKAVFGVLLVGSLEGKEVSKAFKNDDLTGTVINGGDAFWRAAGFEVRIAYFKASQIIFETDTIIHFSIEFVPNLTAARERLPLKFFRNSETVQP